MWPPLLVHYFTVNTLNKNNPNSSKGAFCSCGCFALGLFWYPLWEKTERVLWEGWWCQQCDRRVIATLLVLVWNLCCRRGLILSAYSCGRMMTLYRDFNNDTASGNDSRLDVILSYERKTLIGWRFLIRKVIKAWKGKRFKKRVWSVLSFFVC